MSNFIVAAFYKFADLPDFEIMQKTLLSLCQKHGLRGTILLAKEGINGTISGTRSGMDALAAFFNEEPRFVGMEYKESQAETIPFYRLKVRLKKEIVTIGVPTVNPNKEVGTYVKPEDWNRLISDPDVIVLDTRNNYEVGIGTFKMAVNPETETFREFPNYVEKNLGDYKDKKIAMFCTGGIRCEKASSYMLQEGFKEVYHLQGGILKYLETVKSEESLWEGECFVFDNRVAVTENVKEGSFDQCHACRYPVSAQDMESSHYQKGISCPRCFDKLPEKTRLRAVERQRQVEIATKHNRPHIGRVAHFDEKQH